MKSSIRKFLLLISLCVPLFYMPSVWADTTNNNLAPDIAAIQKRGVLRVGVYQGHSAPLVVNSQGNWSGIEIDLAQMIADQLGVKLQIIPVATYNEMINLVATGQADMSPELAVLPQRALQVTFTHPYYVYVPHLLVNRLQAAKYGWNTPSQVIQGIESGKPGVKLGVLAQSASVQLMQQAFPQITLVQYQDIQTGFQDVTLGKTFAVMGTTPIEIQKFLQTNTKASLLAEDVEVPNIKVMVAIALPWQYFHVRELLNSYFDYLKQNGILEALFEKYGDASNDENN